MCLRTGAPSIAPQDMGGGTWGRCLVDVEAVLARLAASAPAPAPVYAP